MPRPFLKQRSLYGYHQSHPRLRSIETDEFKAEAEQALRELGLTDTNEED